MTEPYGKAEDILREPSLAKQTPEAAALVACGWALLALTKQVSELRQDLEYRDQRANSR